ncbi:hypothetical protein E2C01_051403 [Portunus trituberculatus]|uniref:Uncharacterized protein n=1 Tax=Portunus trituberculatus TaxID=210409 RepID=A0A5B7GLQ4_PORTR|nr:hypothetical protein [Portunus trituberculatus]
MKVGHVLFTLCVGGEEDVRKRISVPAGEGRRKTAEDEGKGRKKVSEGLLREKKRSRRRNKGS